MGLLDQITERNNAEQQAALEQMLQADAHRQETLATRHQIVTNAMQVFATSHQCEYQELNTTRSGRIFLLDELVLAVQEQVYMDPLMAATTQVSDVLWQHFVYLVGLDITGRVRQFKIGTLRMLNLEGIRKAYNQNPGYEFDRSLVTPILFQT